MGTVNRESERTLRLVSLMGKAGQQNFPVVEIIFSKLMQLCFLVFSNRSKYTHSIEIKVIHHIDLNDSDESKKKEILASSWKEQQSKTEAASIYKALISMICGRLIYLTA